MTQAGRNKNTHTNSHTQDYSNETQGKKQNKREKERIRGNSVIFLVISMNRERSKIREQNKRTTDQRVNINRDKQGKRAN